MGTAVSDEPLWADYIRGTAHRYVERSLAFAQSYDQPSPEHYDCLASEEAMLTLALSYARDLGLHEAYCALVRAFCLPTYGYWSVSGRWAEVEQALRHALAASHALGEVYNGALFLGDLCWLWIQRGQYAQADHGYQSIITLLEQHKTHSPRLRDALGTLYQGQGHGAQAVGEWGKADICYQKALLLKREVGNLVGEANALHALGLLAQEQERLEPAAAYFVESQRLSEQQGDHLGTAKALHQRGIVARMRGALEEAEQYFHESLVIKERYRDHLGVALTRHEQATVALKRGDLEGARQGYLESLAVVQDRGALPLMANTLFQLGQVEAHAGQWTVAADWYTQAITLRASMGDQRGEAEAYMGRGLAAEKLNDLDNALNDYQRALLLYQATGTMGITASLLEQLGVMSQRLGKQREAIGYLQQASDLYWRLNEGEAATECAIEAARLRRHENERKPAWQRYILNLLDSWRTT